MVTSVILSKLSLKYLKELQAMTSLSMQVDEGNKAEKTFPMQFWTAMSAVRDDPSYTLDVSRKGLSVPLQNNIVISITQSP
jgi:hypothetical protein